MFCFSPAHKPMTYDNLLVALALFFLLCASPQNDLKLMPIVELKKSLLLLVDAFLQKIFH